MGSGTLGDDQQHLGHRLGLPGCEFAPAGLVDVEQSEVARLNQTGQAKDFDVTGRTGTMITR